MTVEQAQIETACGDQVLVSLWNADTTGPTILLSVADADDSVCPTAELTIADAAQLREVLRVFCAQAGGDRVRG